MKGFYRVAAAVPAVKVGDPAWNADRIIEAYSEAVANGAAIVVFPEMAVTGHSCGDMLRSELLIGAAEDALERIAAATANVNAALIVGTPLRIGSRLFSAAAVAAGGGIAGFAMKEHIPNGHGSAEKRLFSSARDFEAGMADFRGEQAPAGGGLLFSAGDFRFGIEFGDDLQAVIPPSSNLALAGAQAIFCLTAMQESVTGADARRAMVENQSWRISGTYVMAGAGVHESTSSGVCSGHALIAVNGRLSAENTRFQREASIVYADTKPAWSDRLRAAWTSFNDNAAQAYAEPIQMDPLPSSPDLSQMRLDANPFVPGDPVELSSRCHEVLEIQAAALAKCVGHTGAKRLLIGISGGLDSTLALIACVRTCDLLGLPRKFVCAVTMPGFGTSKRTRGNAEKLAELTGVELREIPISAAVEQHFADIGHDPKNRNVVYENAQARERTQILMNLANAEDGFVVGTGDLSESALGWCTFNGDHMSMYNVNCAVPKTLMRHVILHYAKGSGKDLAKVLEDIAKTPVSPELLPGQQHTEDIVGKYHLHEFFLYYFIKYGESPDTIEELAVAALAGQADRGEINKALGVFLSRFLKNQFKRNVSADGPGIGSIGLSPHADWVCPSDMADTLWSKWR